MTTGAVDINSQVTWINFNVSFGRFGKNGNRNRRGMDTTLAFSGWNTLDTVDAGLKL